MTVTPKDGLKLAAVAIICACAAFVCTLFLNYGIDLRAVEPEIPAGPARQLYEASIATENVICAVSGGCLAGTAAVVLFFYITRYIEAHRRQLGILKALGWTRFEISRSFAVFGLSAGIGTFAGWIAAALTMESFYDAMNEDSILPEMSVTIHTGLLIWVCLVPTAVFALAAVLYAARKLKTPAVQLMKGTASLRARRRDAHQPDADFLRQVRRQTLHSSRALAFFVFMGGFCFACMIQMAPSMRELSSVWMGTMMFVLGLVLACTCTFLSVASLVRRCAPSVSIMHAFGWSGAECRRALLSGFRPAALAGFAVGTVYQYSLLRIMIEVFFADFPDLPEYTFDIPACVISLAAFILLFEICCCVYSKNLMAGRLQDMVTE